MKILLVLFFIGLQSLSSSEEILLQSFSTSIEKQNTDVKRNLALAVEKLNGVRIEPNVVFSFSDVVGEASVQNGFVAGRVFTGMKQSMNRVVDFVRFHLHFSICFYSVGLWLKKDTSIVSLWAMFQWDLMQRFLWKEKFANAKSPRAKL